MEDHNVPVYRRLWVWGVAGVSVGLGVGLSLWSKYQTRKLVGGIVGTNGWNFVYPQVHDATPESEADALARLIICETGGRRSAREIAQIAHVAINRAREYQATVRDVAYNAIKTPKYARNRQVWNAGGRWGSMMANASSSARFPDMVAYALQILRGEIPSEIGERTQFIHPHTQIAKGRAIPEWAVSKSQGGSARFEPIMIDGALFS